MENVPKFERRRDGGTLTDSRQIADLCYRDETEGASDLGCSSTSSRVSGVHIIVPDVAALTDVITRVRTSALKLIRVSGPINDEN